MINFTNKKTRSIAWCVVTILALAVCHAFNYFCGPIVYYSINVVYLPAVIVGLIAIKND